LRALAGEPQGDAINRATKVPASELELLIGANNPDNGHGHLEPKFVISGKPSLWSAALLLRS